MSDDQEWKLARRVEDGQSRLKNGQKLSKTVKKEEFTGHARM